MKKLIALLLALLMVPSFALAAPAAEESAPLTYEEINLYLDGLVQTALTDNGLLVTTGEDGVFRASYTGAVLEIADEKLSKSTAVLSAALNPGQEDLRGLRLGDTLSELLEAYPNDNPNLYGTYYDAALYIHGEKPEASVGYVLRDGQRVISVEHLVEHWTQDGVIECSVYYTLDQGTIVDIRISCASNPLPEEEALTTISEVADMQENSEYFAYPQSEDGRDLPPFQREDLSFAGIDFLDITAESAAEAFGTPPVDEWMEDSTGESLRTLQWDGITLLLTYDAQKNLLHADSLTINDDVLEGPRGVRVGDYMDSVIYRFLHNEGGVVAGGITLYGDAEQAPYGVLSYDAEGGAYINYAYALEDGETVIWHLTFVNAQLREMRLLMLL